MESTTEKPKTPYIKPAAKPQSKDDLKSLPMAEVEKKLESSPDGLSDAEARKRLAQYGPNEISEKKTNQLLKFLGYFWGPIPWMINFEPIMSQHLKAAERRQNSILLSEREALGLPPILVGHPDNSYTYRAAWASYRRQAESRCG